MFNVVRFLQVSALSMGVASSTPICNAEENQVTTTETREQANVLSENANTIQNYTINLSYGAWQSQQYSNEEVNNEPNGLNNYGNDNETKRNITATSNYINVIGNDYSTSIQTKGNYLGTGDIWAQNWQNYNTYIENSNFINDVTTQKLQILKLTPYNYNTETIVHLNSLCSFNEFTNNQDGIELDIQAVYLYKEIYITSSDNWDEFIDKQITKYQVDTIQDEIENPNNGFYYTKTTELKTLNIGNTSFTDNNEITIAPNTDNYVVIVYTPIIQARQYNTIYGAYSTITWNNILIPQSSFNVISETITGTNIIPSGTYEVIDLPGLMWEILTMPFAFVSQAFNLTLFPGTPYQLNIANLFLSIIAIAVFVWLISFVLKIKG